MPRDKDPFWDYVEFLENGNDNKKIWKCKFCNKEYQGGATRIKAHLAGVGGFGVNDCKVVDRKVKLEARKGLKRKRVAESSNGSEGNVEERPHQFVTANNQDAQREIPFPAMKLPSSFDVPTPLDNLSVPERHLPSLSRPAQIEIAQPEASCWTHPPQSHAGNSGIQLPDFSYTGSSRDMAHEASNIMLRPVNAVEREPNPEVPQGNSSMLDARTDDALMDSRSSNCGLVYENMPAVKRKLEYLTSREADMDELMVFCRKVERIRGEHRSMVQAFREGRFLSTHQVERVDDLSKEVEDILGHCSFRKGFTTHAAECRRSLPLVTTELVGNESKDAIKNICDYLMKDDIFIIGIYGVGGVGKTAILMHVHNRVLENPAFDDVFWVTVPRKCSVYKVQDVIADAVGLDNLSKVKDVMRRASLLNNHLKKKRAVLILDGLWMHFSIEDVGIPVERGGVKMVLTTQLPDVCRMMLCQRQIEIELLNNLDGWSLFTKKLCFGRELPPEIKEIARTIVDNCHGLPLRIIGIAIHMRGVEKLHQWEGMLQKLKNSEMVVNLFKTE